MDKNACYATACLLDWPCFKELSKLIEKDLSKQQALDAIPKAVLQINEMNKMNEMEIQQCFSLLKKQKKSIQIFQKQL